MTRSSICASVVVPYLYGGGWWSEVVGSARAREGRQGRHALLCIALAEEGMVDAGEEQELRGPAVGGPAAAQRAVQRRVREEQRRGRTVFGSLGLSRASLGSTFVMRRTPAEVWR